VLDWMRQVGRRLWLPRAARELKLLRDRARSTPRSQPGIEHLAGYRIEYVDLLSLYMEYKDIFRHRIYHFDSDRPAPRILDGGGCIGMATLYFKHVYPDARITCFEPDPQIAAVLERNLQTNRLTDVEVVRAALAATEGTRSFQPDGIDGGRFFDGETSMGVPVVRLSRYLDEPVDFLKLNIEGAELEVLREAGDRLHNVRQMVLEYHGWPDGRQRLGGILELLDRRGFRYLLNHLDYESNATVQPPFRLQAENPWFTMVYARRAA